MFDLYVTDLGTKPISVDVRLQTKCPVIMSDHDVTDPGTKPTSGSVRLQWRTHYA